MLHTSSETTGTSKIVHKTVAGPEPTRTSKVAHRAIVGPATTMDHTAIVHFGTDCMDAGIIADVRQGDMNRVVPFLIEIGLPGNVRGVVDIRTPHEVNDKENPGKKKINYVKPILKIPKTGNHTNGISPRIGADNSKYLLGISSAEEPTEGNLKKEKDYSRACRDLHLSVFYTYLEKHKGEHTEEELIPIRAAINFFEKLDPAEVRQHPAIQGLTKEQKKEFFQASNLTLTWEGAPVINGIPATLNDDKVCHAAFLEYFLDKVYNEEGTKYGTCHITGEENVPLVSVTYGGLNTGDKPVYLMSSGRDSEHSTTNFRAWRRCDNFPVSKMSAMILIETLNFLFRDPNHHYQLPNEANILFWSDGGMEADRVTTKAVQQAVFGDRVKETDSEQDKNIAKAVAAMLAGDDNAEALETITKYNGTTFYFLTMKQNTSRMVVKSFECGSFGNIMENVKAFVRDTAVMRRGNEMAGELKGFSLREILRGLKTKKELTSGKTSASVESSDTYNGMFETVVKDGKFPIYVGNLTLRNICFDKWLPQEREAIMRGFVLRNGRDEKCKEAVAKPGLNLETDCQPYLLGRALFILQAIQDEAIGYPDSSIVNRFFSRMVFQPYSVLPELLILSAAHLHKLSRSEAKRGTGAYLGRQLDSVMARLKFPVDENVQARPEQKMTFCLGYLAARTYHYLPKNVKVAVAGKFDPNAYPLELDTECTDMSYVAGRLFYRCEAIQRAAIPEVNNSVKEAFFAMAIGQCERAVPLLLEKASYHLDSMMRDNEKRGIAVWNKQKLKELVSILPHNSEGDLELPILMNGRSESKCNFLLGYFHEKAAQWKKSSKEDTEADEGASDTPHIEN